MCLTGSGEQRQQNELVCVHLFVTLPQKRGRNKNSSFDFDGKFSGSRILPESSIRGYQSE